MKQCVDPVWSVALSVVRITKEARQSCLSKGVTTEEMLGRMSTLPGVPAWPWPAYQRSNRPDLLPIIRSSASARCHKREHTT